MNDLDERINRAMAAIGDLSARVAELKTQILDGDVDVLAKVAYVEERITAMQNLLTFVNQQLHSQIVMIADLIERSIELRKRVDTIETRHEENT